MIIYQRTDGHEINLREVTGNYPSLSPSLLTQNDGLWIQIQRRSILLLQEKMIGRVSARWYLLRRPC